jgi:hypothetical protein
MDEHFPIGALFDNREQEEKDKDYKFEEIVASADPVIWKEKLQSEWRKFPIFQQNGSGSCVAQTQAKEMGIMRWLKDNVYVHFSASHIYQRRNNKPAGGMMASNARKIATEGVTLEVFGKSQNMTDNEMDNLKIEPYAQEVGKVFKVSNYIELPIKDIDTIASVIQKTGKGVMVWFYFQYNEWYDVPDIKNENLELYANNTLRHSVCAVDFFMYKGKKAILIEDSWGASYGLDGQRIITEDFFKVRNWYASYLANFQFQSPEDNNNHSPTPPKPTYNFTKTLKKGDRGGDIVALQNILKFEGLYPTNVESTGYYWSITSKAVYEFQKKHKVASMQELDSLQGNLVGQKTLEKLNQLYN